MFDNARRLRTVYIRKVKDPGRFAIEACDKMKETKENSILDTLRRVAGRDHERAPLRKRGRRYAEKRIVGEVEHEGEEEVNLFAQSFRYPVVRHAGTARTTDIVGCFDRSDVSRVQCAFAEAVGLSTTPAKEPNPLPHRRRRSRRDGVRTGVLPERQLVANAVDKCKVEDQLREMAMHDGSFALHRTCPNVGVTSCFQVDATARRTYAVLCIARQVSSPQLSLSTTARSGSNKQALARLCDLESPNLNSTRIHESRESAYPYAIQDDAAESAQVFSSSLSAMAFSESSWGRSVASAHDANPHAVALRQQVLLGAQKEKQRAGALTTSRSSLVTMSGSVGSTNAGLERFVADLASIQQEWVLRYRPVHTNDLVGNREVRDQFTEWVEKKMGPSPAASFASSLSSVPSCCLLYGPPGTGKKCLVECVARLARCDVVYADEEDQRTLSRLQEWLYHAARSNTRLDNGRGAIVVVDGLHISAQGSEHEQNQNTSGEAGDAPSTCDEFRVPASRRARSTAETLGVALSKLPRTCNPIVFVANDTNSRDVRTTLSAARGMFLEMQRLKEDELFTLATRIKESQEHDATQHTKDTVSELVREIDCLQTKRAAGGGSASVLERMFGRTMDSRLTSELIRQIWPRDVLQLSCHYAAGDARKLVIEMNESFKWTVSTVLGGKSHAVGSSVAGAFGKCDESTHALSGGLFGTVRQLLRSNIKSPNEAAAALHYYPDASDVLVCNMIPRGTRVDDLQEIMGSVSDIDVMGGWDDYCINRDLRAAHVGSQLGAWYLPRRCRTSELEFPGGSHPDQQALHYPPELLSASRQHAAATRASCTLAMRAFGVSSRCDARLAMEVTYGIRKQAFETGVRPWHVAMTRGSTGATCHGASDDRGPAYSASRSVGLVELSDGGDGDSDVEGAAERDDAWGTYWQMQNCAGFTNAEKMLEHAESSVAHAHGHQAKVCVKLVRGRDESGRCLRTDEEIDVVTSLYAFPSSGVRRASGGKLMSRVAPSVSSKGTAKQTSLSSFSWKSKRKPGFGNGRRH